MNFFQNSDLFFHILKKREKDLIVNDILQIELIFFLK